METFSEIIKNIAQYAGYITTIFILIGLVFKPVRKWIVQKMIIFTHKKEIDELFKSISNINKYVKNGFKEFETDIVEIKQMLFVNEKDRLKGELFNYGNKCRRGDPITLEEFRYIQEVYTKYNETLHCNHNGTEEYEFIRDYFNSKKNQENIKK